MKANIQELTAHKANISDNTQLYCPFAYSLTIRHEGSNSGLRMCKMTRSKRTPPDVAITKYAVGSEISVAPMVVVFVDIRFILLFGSLTQITLQHGIEDV
jgi:hypothetical protein